MKKNFVIFVLFFVGLLFIAPAAEELQVIWELNLSTKIKDTNFEDAVNPFMDSENFSLHFTCNRGQVNNKAKFYSSASWNRLWLTRNQSNRCFYLYPYNLHLTPGATSNERLVVKDNNGNIVEGYVVFYFNTDLLSISQDGYVTALRQENPDEIGDWVGADIDGQWVENACIVRVLSQEYGVPFEEIQEKNTVLYYPTLLGNENIAQYVTQYHIPSINEYAYRIQESLMGLRPFNGCRQVFEVDFGDSEKNRVCGISGNPIRLGWNIEGNKWQNCFLVPFYPPRSPQWFLIYHELGHNFTWPSIMFGQGLGAIISYSEGLASALFIEVAKSILSYPWLYPINTDVQVSLLNTDVQISIQGQLEMYNNIWYSDFQNWLNTGTNFNELNANIVDGIYIHYRNIRGNDFGDRFYFPLRPAYYMEPNSKLPELLEDVDAIGDAGRHTFFAALVSGAMEQDLSYEFANSYSYPIDQTLFDQAFGVLTNILSSYSSITVTSPNGGEKLNVGTSHTIAWTTSETIGNVKIDYSTDIGSSWSTIASSTSNDGAYIWTVPNTDSTSNLVRISEASDGIPWDASDAVFAIMRQYTLNLASSKGGTTDPSPGIHTYDNGIPVSVVAIANSGYTFSNWKGDVPSGQKKDNPLNITMDSDKSITANFSQIQTGGGDDRGGSGSGCFIATACYGTPMAEEVTILCTFRDKYLLTNPEGQALVELYYSLSPMVADFIKDKEYLKTITREGLRPFIWLISRLVQHS